MIILPFAMIILLGFGYLNLRAENARLKYRLEKMKAVMILGKRRT